MKKKIELSTLTSNILINDITVNLPPIIDERYCWGGPDDLSSGTRSDKRFCPVNPRPGTIKRAMCCLLLLRGPHNKLSGPPLMEPECH
ncbi:MAG: hypothetical protein JRG73_20535 [Deltaproteobacteria bacterium]|nr:hypothetical protein [Deltaproteobacteria bacterium]